MGFLKTSGIALLFGFAAYAILSPKASQQSDPAATPSAPVSTKTSGKGKSRTAKGKPTYPKPNTPEEDKGTGASGTANTPPSAPTPPPSPPVSAPAPAQNPAQTAPGQWNTTFVGFNPATKSYIGTATMVRDNISVQADLQGKDYRNIDLTYSDGPALQMEVDKKGISAKPANKDSQKVFKQLPLERQEQARNDAIAARFAVVLKESADPSIADGRQDYLRERFNREAIATFYSPMIYPAIVTGGLFYGSGFGFSIGWDLFGGNRTIVNNTVINKITVLPPRQPGAGTPFTARNGNPVFRGQYQEPTARRPNNGSNRAGLARISPSPAGTQIRGGGNRGGGGHGGGGHR